jgi:hypothetical protein
MIESIFLYEQTNLVRWLRLKIAVLDVVNFVEETSDVESQTIFFLGTEGFGIFCFEDPSTL